MNPGAVLEAWSRASSAVLKGVVPSLLPSTPSQMWVQPPSQLYGEAVKLRGFEVIGPSKRVVVGLSMRRLGVEELTGKGTVSGDDEWPRKGGRCYFFACSAFDLKLVTRKKRER